MCVPDCVSERERDKKKDIRAGRQKDTYRERESERETHTHTHRKREREREI